MDIYDKMETDKDWVKKKNKMRKVRANAVIVKRPITSTTKKKQKIVDDHTDKPFTDRFLQNYNMQKYWDEDIELEKDLSNKEMMNNKPDDHLKDKETAKDEEEMMENKQIPDKDFVYISQNED